MRLEFAAPGRPSFEMGVWIPGGAGPFPVLLVAPRHYQIPWAEDALARGYLVCLYPGIDHMHSEPDYAGWERAWEAFRAAHPGATWTEILAKAWLASRALDHILDPGSRYPVARGQVAIIGHSRYGKQAMVAAAFDERIAAVVARSAGTPASTPYRFASDATFSEPPDGFPGSWFLESLRAYRGREHELPIDAHGWLALIAPRRLLLHTAHHDDCDPTFGVEMAYREGREVYRLLGAPERLRIRYRAGGHDPILEEHRKADLEWFDLAFGRGTARDEDFPEEWLHAFDWSRWRAAVPENDARVPFAGARASSDPADRRARILWALGVAPEKIPWDGTLAFLSDAESALMTHDRWALPGTARVPVAFGEGVRGNVYFDRAARPPLPAVIWLHPYSYASGYTEGYNVQDTTVYHRLAKEGFAVLAFDQCGFGLRLLEGTRFYERHPRWSRLGRMVHDVRRAVDFLAEGKGRAQDAIPEVRRDRVCVLGYSLGGMVGLYAAALDERIAAVACFAGFTPLRSDTDAQPTGGNRRLYEQHALQPRLGYFRGREEEVPYDFEDVLALVAPRPCLLVSPLRDRHADAEAVARTVTVARKAWEAAGAPEALTLLAPDDVSRFQSDQHRIFLEWIRGR